MHSGKYYYKVHETTDPNSKVIHEGFRSSVCYGFLISCKSFNYQMKNKNNVILKKHYVEAIPYRRGMDISNMSLSKNKKTKKLSKFEEKVKTYEKLLDIYGNTIACSDPEEAIKAMEEDGYFVKVTHEPRRVIKTNCKVDITRVEVWDECWILELIKKESKE